MREDFVRVAPHNTKPSRDVKLEIYYDPETDTLDIGNGQPAAEGYDVAENMTAHVDGEGDVVLVTLEHANEILAPFLHEHIAIEEPREASEGAEAL